MTRRIKRPQSIEENVSLPYHYTPRGYQLPVLHALDNGTKRGVLVWHRRSGKDKTTLNYTVKCMVPIEGNPNGRVGVYYHLFPTFNQSRKILWNGIGADGFRYIDHFPKDLVENKDEAKMQITLTNGSIW